MKFALTAKEKRLAVIMVLIVVITGLGPQFVQQYAQEFLREQSAFKQNIEGEIVELRNRLSGIEDEREAVRVNQQNYVEWVDRGVVGEQDPVAWVKVMKQIQASRRFFPLSYNFSSEELQSPSVSPFTDGSSVQIRMWGMSMEMPMLHDLDMLIFLESLQQQVNSFFFPVECTFNLLQPEFSLVSRQNMTSQCQLVWMSVEDPERRQEDEQ